MAINNETDWSWHPDNPNVARLLRAWGVDQVIGDNLVGFKDGTNVGWAPISRMEKMLEQPWWLVHRCVANLGKMLH